MKVRNCKGKILIADSLDYKFIYGEKKNLSHRLI